MKYIKKITLLSLSAFLAFSLFGCNKRDSKEEQKKFDDFINTEFVEAMQDNYLNAHIYTEKPEKFGIDKSKIKVQVDNPMNEETEKNISEEVKKSEKAFNSFHRDDLTDEQKETYDIFKYMLDINLKSSDEKYKFMEMNFATLTGIHTQLPTLFADLTLRNEDDVKALIKLVESTKPYIDSVLQYTKKQAENGTMMIDIDNVLDYCKKIQTAGSNSSTLKSMNANIEALKLDKQKTKSYQEELKKAFDSSFLPSYDNIINTLTSLKKSKNNTQGMSHLKNGKEYYEILFKNATGSDESIAEMKKKLEKLSQSSMLKAQAIVAKNPDAYSALLDGKATTKYKDFETMLKDLNKDIKGDFPSIGDLNYVIKPLDKDLANNGVAAYFNLPALDGTTPKQIRVNTQGDSLKINSLETFSTVAHEGLPGHMYQVTYAYENLPNPWRKVVASFSGYQEGYATYVELYALKYLKNVDSSVIGIQQNLTVYQNCIVSLLDIGIHYDGWSLNEAKSFMEDNGLDASVANELYKQIQANPTAFLSYYVGYAQFAELKEKAENALGEKFKDKDFHEAILKSGSAPFKVVEGNVDAYIKSAK